MVELIGTRLGGYTLLEEIGRGGMARVYEGLELETGRRVAIKVLHPQLLIDSKFKTRFARESEVLSNLDHPNIAPILDYGEAEGQMYIVMPFMDIGSLADRLEGGPLNVEEGARIIAQIASALEYAHDAGVVHRDVKPSNILVDQEGRAMLSDFGFAHIVDTSLSLTGSALVGTPAYMSPEQIHGDKITPKTDQYALGVVLYQISTGYLPYEGETPMSVAIKHATQPLPRPRSVNPKLPDAVERVIIRAMSKNPDDRFESIAAFNEAFQAALEVSIDSVSRSFRPGALSPVIHETLPEGVVADHLMTASLEPLTEKEPERSRRWLPALLLLLLLFACPASIWLFTRIQNGAGFAVAVGTEDIQATVYALGTANAPELGTELSPDDVQTIVAATLTALAPAKEDVQIKLPWGVLEKGAIETLAATSTQATSSAVETAEPGGPTLSSPTSTKGVSPTRDPTATATLSDDTDPTTAPTPTNTTSWSPTSTTTSTPEFTSTFTPVPTLTPSATPPSSPTPSKTPTVDICLSFELSDFDVDGQEVEWRISNQSGASMTIEEIHLTWPGANQGLEKIELGGNVIWDKGDVSPPTHITSGWRSGVSRTIGAGSSSSLMFQYDNEAKSNGYKLDVGLDNGCTLSD